VTSKREDENKRINSLMVDDLSMGCWTLTLARRCSSVHRGRELKRALIKVVESNYKDG
jgi:hypothetical protein